jgi:SAM-dependent methyltransferase
LHLDVAATADLVWELEAAAHVRRRTAVTTTGIGRLRQRARTSIGGRLASRLSGHQPSAAITPGPDDQDRSAAYPSLLEWNTGAYRRHVRDLIATHELDEAMALAIGGWWDEAAPLLEGALALAGLGRDGLVVDVGCGAGRLAQRIEPRFAGTYVGCDVVPELVAYARDHSSRPEWRFELTSTPTVPVDDASADIVCFFSVFTHLPHEATYAYLLDCWRALRPGGAVVASFLEFADPALWPVFEAMVGSISSATHLNQFIHRDDLRTWCTSIGLVPERFIGATEAVIPILDADGRESGRSHFGQALMILRR